VLDDRGGRGVGVRVHVRAADRHLHDVAGPQRARGAIDRARRGTLEQPEALDAVVVAVRWRLPGSRRQCALQLEALRRVLEDLDDRPARAGDDGPGFEHGRF
jgi:hypothetical protein